MLRRPIGRGFARATLPSSPALWSTAARPCTIGGVAALDRFNCERHVGWRWQRSGPTPYQDCR